MPIKILAGSSQHQLYKVITWSLFALLVAGVAFAYVDVGSISLGENNYNISLIRLNKAIAFAIAILGLQVVAGFTGQLALGQSFFFGMGAYASAWLMADHDWPFLLTFIVVVPLCFVIGIVMGLPALRIQGLYLALVTLGFAAVFPAIVKLDRLFSITNGVGGKATGPDGRKYKLEPPEWLPLDGIAETLQKIPLLGGYFGDGGISSKQEERMWAFMMFTLIAVVCFWMVANLIKSRQGRAMRAVRDNPTGAAVSGIDLARTKAMSFGIASALGGVGGAVYVAEVGLASPDDFTQLLAINFIVGLVVGGVGTLSGAVVGGLVIALVPDWASSTQEVGFLPERWLQGPTGSLILGLLLILLTFFLPGGIVSAARTLKNKIVRIIPRGPNGEVPGGASLATPVTADDTPDEPDSPVDELVGAVD